MQIPNYRPRYSITSVEVKYADSLPQLYETPPTKIVSLIEFQEYAVERFKVLKAVDEAVKYFDYERNKANVRPADVDVMEIFMREFKKLDNIQLHLKSTKPSIADVERDQIGHFILRLACCKSADMRQWFLHNEIELFKFRFKNLGKEAKQSFLSSSMPNCLKMSTQNKNELAQHLWQSCPSTRNKVHKIDKSLTIEQRIEHCDFYEVPFWDAIDLVKLRNCYLRKGVACISGDDLQTIVLQRFRSNLSLSLSKLSLRMGRLQEEERILPILQKLGNRYAYVGPDYNNGISDAGERVTPGQLDALSSHHYPLCMQQLHDVLQRDHHLKHHGRMQYGLFLKGIGLSLEDSLMYWAQQFAKGGMDQEYFDKHHAYNIRHNYGKEGKRADYTPYSCYKIVTHPPGPMDAHGCPFKHSDTKTLEKKLFGLKLTSEQVSDIMDSVRKSNCQGACTRLLEYRHGLLSHSMDTVAHPNHYFEMSCKVAREKTR